MSSAWYGEDSTNGTISVTNGSTTVTGSGTSWLTNKAVPASAAGYGLLGPDGKLYGIASCSADTGITLTKNYGGSTASAQPYAIVPISGPVVDLLNKIQTLLGSSNYSQIAGLSPSTNDSIRYKSGAWTNRSIIQDLLDLFNGLSEVNIASSSTCDIGSATSPRVQISGTTTITSLGTQFNALRFVRLSGSLILTHNATTLVLPGAANITTSTGDAGIFASDGSGNWRCIFYQLASGIPLPSQNPTIGGHPTIEGVTSTGATGTGKLVFDTAPTITGATVNGSTIAKATRQILLSGSSATYTTPANCRQIKIIMVGAGGGGSGGASSSAPGAGGTTTFNSINANGGGAAQFPQTTGNALSGTGTGTASFRAQGGCSALTYATDGYGQPGAKSSLGCGGIGALSGAGGAAPANSGGGGGGAFKTGTYGGSGGGAGEYVEIIINSPSATYTYTVGAGGAGGTATNAGGAGGSGLIIVEENY
jgi:hypothetical protein